MLRLATLKHARELPGPRERHGERGAGAAAPALRHQKSECHCARLCGDPGAILAAAAFVAECDALVTSDRNRLAQGHVPTRSPVADTLAAMSTDAAGVLVIIVNIR